MRIPAALLFCSLTILSTCAAELTAPKGGEDLRTGSSLKAYADPSCGTAKQLEDGTWQIDISKPDESKPFLAQVSMDCPASGLAAGEVVLAIVKARATSATPASLEAKLQLSGPPYTTAAAPAALDLSQEWQELPVVFRVSEPLEKGRAALVLFCAHRLQTVEVASVRTYKYPAGTDTSAFPRIRRTYAGRAADAPWRKAALERIEKNRKADLSLQVLGTDVKPLANTEVTLTLRRHEFGFGSAVTAALLTADTDDARRYREIVDRLFSRVVFENDFKDFGWEPNAEGKEDRLRQLDQAIGWLGQRHISIRGHYLVQCAVPPNLAQVTDPESIRQHFIGTAKERIAFAKDRVCEWDVVNHPVAWTEADMLTRRPGLEKLDREIYRLAEKESSLPFFVNEDQIFRPGRQSDETFEYLRQLKSEGFRVDGLGNQAHVDETYLPSPEQVLAITDHFATLVPHQVITEFDITTLDDEELAADYTRDLLISCFSHPAYSGFLFWGFWEGSHWKPEAASWNSDWTARKRGEVIEEWIGKRWRTSVTLTTDKDGTVKWRGFPGWYDISTGKGAPEVNFNTTMNKPSATVNIH